MRPSHEAQQVAHWPGMTGREGASSCGVRRASSSPQARAEPTPPLPLGEWGWRSALLQPHRAPGSWLAPCDVGPPGEGAVDTPGLPGLTPPLTGSYLSPFFLLSLEDPSLWSNLLLQSEQTPGAPGTTCKSHVWTRRSQGQPGSGTQKQGPCGVWRLGDRPGLAARMGPGGLPELDLGGSQHAVSHAPPCLGQARGVCHLVHCSLT